MFSGVILLQTLSDVVCSDKMSDRMTTEEIDQILDLHNIYRSFEDSGDMERQIWNDRMESLARVWAANCDFEHPDKSVNKEYDNVGQNLYVTSAKTVDLARPMFQWYDEIKDHNYDTLTCTAGKMCGHYTQLVWAHSRYVGCAYHYCDQLKSATNIPKGILLVCNYAPSGNVKIKGKPLKPYLKGPACSMCSNRAGWCKENLCNWQCSGPGKDCKCAAICYNCGKLDLKTCRCSCSKGWMGADCSVRCQDNMPDYLKKKNAVCNPGPGQSGIPPSHCKKKNIPRICPSMCGVCTKAETPPEPDQCPPVFGIRETHRQEELDAEKSAAAGVIVYSTQAMFTGHHGMMMPTTLLLALIFTQ